MARNKVQERARRDKAVKQSTNVRRVGAAGTSDREAPPRVTKPASSLPKDAARQIRKCREKSRGLDQRRQRPDAKACEHLRELAGELRLARTLVADAPDNLRQIADALELAEQFYGEDLCSRLRNAAFQVRAQVLSGFQALGRVSEFAGRLESLAWVSQFNRHPT